MVARVCSSRSTSLLLRPCYNFFANYTFCYITSTFAKVNEKNNRDVGFETRHFDEGRRCDEPPCTSLFQRSRMLMQKDPCFYCIEL